MHVDARPAGVCSHSGGSRRRPKAARSTGESITSSRAPTRARWRTRRPPNLSKARGVLRAPMSGLSRTDGLQWTGVSSRRRVGRRSRSVVVLLFTISHYLPSSVVVRCRVVSAVRAFRSSSFSLLFFCVLCSLLGGLRNPRGRNSADGQEPQT